MDDFLDKINFDIGNIQAEEPSYNEFDLNIKIVLFELSDSDLKVSYRDL